MESSGNIFYLSKDKGRNILNLQADDCLASSHEIAMQYLLTLKNIVFNFHKNLIKLKIVLMVELSNLKVEGSIIGR